MDQNFFNQGLGYMNRWIDGLMDQNFFRQGVWDTLVDGWIDG
jgi:hypothetical protein